MIIFILSFIILGIRKTFHFHYDLDHILRGRWELKSKTDKLKKESVTIETVKRQHLSLTEFQRWIIASPWRSFWWLWLFLRSSSSPWARSSGSSTQLFSSPSLPLEWSGRKNGKWLSQDTTGQLAGPKSGRKGRRHLQITTLSTTWDHSIRSLGCCCPPPRPPPTTPPPAPSTTPPPRPPAPSTTPPTPTARAPQHFSRWLLIKMTLGCPPMSRRCLKNHLRISCSPD